MGPARDRRPAVQPVGAAPLSSRVAAVAVAGLAWAAAAGSARAEPAAEEARGEVHLEAPAAGPACEAGPAGDRFPTCFDLGTRLYVGGDAAWREGGDGEGDDGGGDLAPVGTFGLAVRHVVTTEDPAVWWRLEHVVLESRVGRGLVDGAAYRGRYIRHSRDGRIVLPTSPPRKIFLPFDLGAEVDVGTLRAVRGAGGVEEGGKGGAELGVVRTGLFLEVLRSPSFRHRLALGAVGRWDVSIEEADGDPGGGGGGLNATEQRVAPFTMGMLAGHIESASGLTMLDLSAEGGRTWSSETGWHWGWSGRASLERILVALDDRPLSIVGELKRTDPGGWSAAAGLRIALWAPPGPP